MGKPGHPDILKNYRIEDFILYKEEQPAYRDPDNWKEEFELD